MAPEQRLTKARGNIVLRQPFFGALLLRLGVHETKRIPTMATDGQKIYYNPSFVESKSDVDLQAIMIHEVVHVILKHHLRRGDRDTGRWNEACDHAVNLEMKRSDEYVPPDGLADPQYIDMSAEQIYDLLEEPPETEEPDDSDDKESDAESGSGDNDGSSAGENDEGEDTEPDSDDTDQDDDSETEDGDSPAEPDDFDDGADGDTPDDGDSHGSEPDPIDDPTGMGVIMDAEQPIEEERELDSAIIQAAMLSRLAGENSLMAQRLAEEAKNPPRDWREAMRDIATPVHGGEYSWSKGNRRFVASGLYLPSIVPDDPPPFFAAIDASGSINNRVLGMFLGELQSILDDVRPERIDLAVFNTQLGEISEHEAGDDLTRLKVLGGGGTDFRCAFTKLEDDIVASIILTDGYCDKFPQEPEQPTLWIIEPGGDPGFDPPFGEVVFMR